MNDLVVNERAQHLLRSLVGRYIREGQPIGSKALLEESGLSVSPATVRNIMADLEQHGLIASPHTSAGRVPTSAGYRVFVDSLLAVSAFNSDSLLGLERELSSELLADKSSQELIDSASQLLSGISAQVGLVTVPRQNQETLRQIEFLPLSGDRVLVILVLNEREVQNRVIHTGRAYSEVELRQAANEINHRFGGRSLDALRQQLLSAMQADKDSIDRYLQSTLDLAQATFSGEQPSFGADYVLSGETQLIDSAAPERLDKIKGLFAAFEQKRDILDLVDRCIAADGMQIFIGEEAGYEALGDFSVVTAPYGGGSASGSERGEPLGVLGVIGPTRMAYERVIPIVDITARLLSAALARQTV